MASAATAARAAYAAALAAAAIALVVGALDRGVPLPWIATWLAELSLLAWAPRWPLVGLVAFLAMDYGVSSHGTLHDTLLALRALDAVAALALAAWWIARQPGDGQAAHGPPRASAWLAAALFVWVALCLAAALAGGLPWGPFPRHDPSRFFQAGAMLVVAAGSLRSVPSMLAMSAVLAAVVAARAALQGPDGIHLESYLATLAVVSLPLVLVGALLARSVAARAAFVLAALAMAVLVVAGENRAAAVALAAAALTALVQALRWGPQRRLAAAGGIVAFVAASTWLAASDNAARFRSLWDAHAHAGSGLDRGTAAERLQIWRAGWEMAVQHPLFGVGPGNFQALLPIYRPGMDPLAGHSNYVQMLAETGFPGLVLYLAVFVTALLALGRVAAGTGGDRRAGAVARLLQIALVAYLAGGVFNSRHDLVLAYILVGWCFAVAAKERSA